MAISIVFIGFRAARQCQTPHPRLETGEPIESPLERSDLEDGRSLDLVLRLVTMAQVFVVRGEIRAVFKFAGGERRRNEPIFSCILGGARFSLLGARAGGFARIGAVTTSLASEMGLRVFAFMHNL